MKQKLLASLKNSDTGESYGVVCIESVSLSSLEIAFYGFSMEILKKAHQFITKQSCSACLCLELFVERRLWSFFE